MQNSQLQCDAFGGCLPTSSWEKKKIPSFSSDCELNARHPKLTLPGPLRGQGGEGQALGLKPQGWAQFQHQWGSKERGHSSLITLSSLNSLWAAH